MNNQQNTAGNVVGYGHTAPMEYVGVGAATGNWNTSRIDISMPLPQPPTPVIYVELEHLQESVKELEQTLYSLFDRLNPVFLPGQPKVESKCSEDVMVCPLAQTVKEIRFHVARISASVHDAHEALQL